MTALLGMGSTPGCPVHTGQILVLGGSPQESALQEQKILLWVFSWMWVSRPITVSYLVMGLFYPFIEDKNVKMIGVDDKGMVNFIQERECICIECGQCMAICPNDAVKIAKYTYEDNLINLPENSVDYQKYIDYHSRNYLYRLSWLPLAADYQPANFNYYQSG